MFLKRLIHPFAHPWATEAIPPPPRPELLGFRLSRTCRGGQKVFIRRQFPSPPAAYNAPLRDTLTSEIEEV